MRKTAVSLCIGLLAFMGIAVSVFAANTHSLDLEASSSQYASITDASQTGLDLTTAATIEAWVKPESQPGESTGLMIVSKHNNSSSEGYHLNYRQESGVFKLMFYVSGNNTGTSADAFKVNQTLDNGTWYHVAVTWDGSAKTAKFYVDGVKVGSDQVGTNVATINNSSSSFKIGAGEASGTPNLFWDGFIDDVRVWNIIRNASDIAANYNRELVGTESNLQGYWKLNNSYSDETTNNNDLSASGSPVFSTDVPSFTAASLVIVRKSSDESVTSSTTLQNDDQLVLSLAPSGSTYFVEGLVLASSSSDTPDIKIAFTVPSGATMDIAYISSRGSTFNHGELLEASGTASITIPVDNANVTVIMVRGTVKLSTTTGNLQLQWAQATSNATATTVREGSFLSAASQ